MAGAKEKYRDDWPDRVREMAKQGLIEQDIAYNLKVARSTFCRIKNKYPQLQEALDEGKRFADQIVESALFKRATGYEYEEVHTEVSENGNGNKKQIKKVKKHVSPDTGACMAWLKNRSPKLWRDKQEIENTHRGELKITTMDDDEAQEIIRRAGLVPADDPLDKLESEPIEEVNDELPKE